MKTINQLLLAKISTKASQINLKFDNGHNFAPEIQRGIEAKCNADFETLAKFRNLAQETMSPIEKIKFIGDLNKDLIFFQSDTSSDKDAKSTLDIFEMTVELFKQNKGQQRG
jgi:hypothetical protein